MISLLLKGSLVIMSFEWEKRSSRMYKKKVSSKTGLYLKTYHQRSFWFRLHWRIETSLRCSIDKVFHGTKQPNFDQAANWKKQLKNLGDLAGILKVQSDKQSSLYIFFTWTSGVFSKATGFVHCLIFFCFFS